VRWGSRRGGAEGCWEGTAGEYVRGSVACAVETLSRVHLCVAACSEEVAVSASTVRPHPHNFTNQKLENFSREVNSPLSSRLGRDLACFGQVTWLVLASLPGRFWPGHEPGSARPDFLAGIGQLPGFDKDILA
jgi:hypothetical protein